ncbi:MAG: asparaginase [Candidatus Planktophila sp.]|jgi:L-asparaginase II|nr:asparaginase [Candidatus Planktophila sp.]
MLGEILAEVVRSGVVESIHAGHFVALNSDGSILTQKGDPTRAMYSRSSLKSIQASAMVRAGLDLEPRLLALVCASHAGTAMHQDGALEILGKAGLDASALMCVMDRPLDELLRRSAVPTRLAMNCSGKHAGMILTCHINGWPIDSYLDESHPLQIAIKDEVETMSGEKISLVSVDGCGAPLFMFSLLGLARAVRALTLSTDRVHQAVVQACRENPEMVSGQGRLATRMMQSIPGLFMKDGAEAFNVASLPDGRTFALKISDGNSRAIPAVSAAILKLFGVDAHEIPDPVYGGGKVIGSIRATF